MADIRLTSGADLYVQPAADKNLWNNIFGLEGNDTLRLYQGIAIGGPGNDRFEKLVDPDNPNRELQLAYWSAGDNLFVNLAEGWANDGEGGRDTFLGVDRVHGSGSKNATVIGNDRDNYYWANGGTDTFNGGAGRDGINVNGWAIPAPGLAGRDLVLSELDIQVSVDGRNATVRPKFQPDAFVYRTVDVEYFTVRSEPLSDTYLDLLFVDFITPQAMAQDAIAAGGNLRWNATAALGSAVALSYSFVTTAPASGVGATGFRSFTTDEREAVRDILAKTAQLTNLSFSEVTESGSTVGQLRFGVSQQTTSKGVAWLPNQAGAGDQAGDVWMDVESMLNLAVGGEGFQALIHEIGHALGLRHPRNVDAGDNWALQLRDQDDKQSLTVMSQTPTADGLRRSDWGPLDVLALRHLYGSRAANTGNNAYTLTAAFGNQEQTITDDGGIDTIDASALSTGVQLTLAPGSLSNVGLSSNGVLGVDNLALTTGTLIEHAIGTGADDELLGNDADNSLTGGLGNDWLDGGKGIDTAVFASPRAAYEIDHAFGLTYVRARDGVSGYDTLVNIERLQFSDQTLVLATGPLAEDVNFAVDEDAQLSGSLPTPSDVSNRASVTWAMVSTPISGRATLAANGSFSYTPNADFWGNDSFSFRVSTAAGSNTYRVYINVKAINDGAPIGASQTLMVPVGAIFAGQVPAATDIDGDVLSYAVVDDPSRGTLAFSANGAYVYTPAAGAYGDDSFSYAVSDGVGGSNTYTMTLRVGLQGTEDTPMSTLLPDPVGSARAAAQYTLVTAPAKGQMTISAQGVLNFAPSANANGIDSFVYEVKTGTASARHTVGLRIEAVNDGPPVAANASHTVAEDGRLQVALPVATEPDGDTVVYALATAPSLGIASISASGQLIYTPRRDVNGNDSLSYTVTDSVGSRNTYTVALRVTPVNDMPQAADVEVSVKAGGVLYGLLPTGRDSDDEPLLYGAGTAATKGQVSISASGRFTYTPNAGAAGNDSFGYIISDDQGGSSSFVVRVTIRPATNGLNGQGSLGESPADGAQPSSAAAASAGATASFAATLVATFAAEAMPALAPMSTSLALDAAPPEVVPLGVLQDMAGGPSSIPATGLWLDLWA